MRRASQVRTHKYGAKPTTIDGVRFASQKEACRYRELKMLHKAREILDLELQPMFDLHVAGQRVCRYVADFRYLDCRTGAVVVEDAKGMKTPMYRLKRKMVEAEYGIEIIEV